MIKKSELRIGNIYQYRDKSYINFGQIKNGAEIDEMEDSCFEPVELTPEILEKAGFINDDFDYGDNNLWFNKSLPDSDGLFIDINIYKDEIRVFIRQDIIGYAKCLHQLQNLYFALSGEELTITL